MIERHGGFGEHWESKFSGLIEVVYVTVMLLLIGYSNANCGLFGEHKHIGDKAFKQFLTEAIHPGIERSWLDSLGIWTSKSAIPESMDVARPADCPCMCITYGDLTALSGDHAIDQELLLDGVLNTSSELMGVLKRQHKAISEGKKEDGSFTYDLSYVWLAAEDQSHFYHLGQSLEQQLGDLHPDLLLTYLENYNPEIRTTLVHDFWSSNLVVRYAGLHILALDIATFAAERLNGGDTLMGVQYFRKAVIANAFADHFLQDAFAAGHLAVDRSPRSLGDNRGTHNYYCRTGIEVESADGKEHWTEFGDGYIDDCTVTEDKAVRATAISIAELWQQFVNARNGEADTLSPVYGLKHLHATDYAHYLLQAFKALHRIPKPLSIDAVRFGNSRGGALMSFAARNPVVSPAERRNCWMGSAGSGIGWILAEPPRWSDAESRLWLGADVRYDWIFSNFNDGDAWLLGVETIIYDTYSISVHVPVARAGEFESLKGIASLGYEYKPVSWSFAPSVKFDWSVSSLRPAGDIRFEIRYY